MTVIRFSIYRSPTTGWPPLNFFICIRCWSVYVITLVYTATICYKDANSLSERVPGVQFYTIAIGQFFVFKRERSGALVDFRLPSRCR
jgi:hypothetical protein